MQLFMVVNVRGGYESVCVTFRWADVCRSLGCENNEANIIAMRVAYERSLLEFEQYVRSGRYLRERAIDAQPQWMKADTDAAMEQCMRAGKVAQQAAAAAAARPAQAAPRPAAVPGPRGALSLAPGAAAGAAALMGLPGGLQVNAVALAQAQLAQQIRLQQQAQILAAQKAGRPVGAAAAGLVRPAAAGAQQQAANVAALQQQLLMRQQLLQQAQLLQGNNPQLQALLLHQQQQQVQLAAAAAAAGAGRPPGAAAPAAQGVLTMAQLQALQQLKPGGATVAAAQAGVPAAAAAGGLQAAAAAQGQPAVSQPLANAGSVNFSAMLGDM